jgi:4,5-DOPA dioxygenase extradiol
MGGAMMPAVFIGHGSPMNTLEQNTFTLASRKLGRAIPRTRAILCISAHWGLDHGTWSVLAHVFPNADIPVVQPSLNAEEPPEFHIELGRRLGPLRERGVFILASGNVVHNLRRLDPERARHPFDWAERFDFDVRQIMTIDPRALGSVTAHPDYVRAAPTAEHFMPLYYLAGLCDAAKERATVFMKGGAMGSLTMTRLTLSMPQGSAAQADGVGATPASGHAR